MRNTHYIVKWHTTPANDRLGLTRCQFGYTIVEATTSRTARSSFRRLWPADRTTRLIIESVQAR
jgi:hypothetical protein